MKNKEIGHIISKGGSVEDIQKVVSNFPSNPTKETFIELGYAESTAKRYIYLLSQNYSDKKIDNVESRTKVQIDNLININQSVNVDYENILVDTCALGSANCRQIIGTAKHVTFIFSTLEEMDKKKREFYNKKKKGEIKENDDLAKVAKYIPIYTSKILNSPDKYMVSKFAGNLDENYPDNVLLQYLEILPKQIRPTLLTQDRNLAAKAVALELNYIYIDKNDTGENEKNLGNGIMIYKRNEEFYIIYNGTQTLEIYRDGRAILYTQSSKFKVQRGDILCLNEGISKHIIEID